MGEIHPTGVVAAKYQGMISSCYTGLGLEEKAGVAIEVAFSRGRVAGTVAESHHDRRIALHFLVDLVGGVYSEVAVFRLRCLTLALAILRCDYRERSSEPRRTLCRMRRSQQPCPRV
jgi:hypothetical protein